MKKAICFVLSFLMLAVSVFPMQAMAEDTPKLTEDGGDAVDSDTGALQITAKSAILMDFNTGSVLYEKNADEALPPASVTKIMTLLLVMEAVDSGKIALTDMISTSENAASKGGSQVYLEVGETMSVDELLKCVIIASANDAATALAECVAGSEGAFVEAMNARAAELGMTKSHFENVTGLDDTVENHVTSARDIAIMSRELMKHDHIFNYTTIWMDTVRSGAFGLTNTNRLVRFYSGCTGLKTGSTAKAKFCMSATAKRNGLHLIAVIMGAETRDTRNEEAKMLLDYGFANYEIYKSEARELCNVPVLGGISDICTLKCDGIELLVKKGIAKNITENMTIPEYVPAPIKAGDKLGAIIYVNGNEEIGRADIVAAHDVSKISFAELFLRVVKIFLLS